MTLLIRGPLCSALNIPPVIKESVVFITTNEQVKISEKTITQTIAIGTGFFVGVPAPDGKSARTYIATAKHVLLKCDSDDANCFLRKEVGLRLNRRDGSSYIRTIPLFADGVQQNVFLHGDASVDLAVIAVGYDLATIRQKWFGLDVFISPDTGKSSLLEGKDVFFTGLFTPYVGYNENVPITRFGKIALMPSEKILWKGIRRDLLLLEMGSFGGNSGSPVFLYVDPKTDNPNRITIGAPPAIHLMGIMIGTYRDYSKVQEVETAKTPIAFSSMGIAAVVPAERLREIITGKQLVSARGF